MKAAIIGAGKMGLWFTRFFLEEGIPVIVSDKNKQILSKINCELGVETSDNINAVRTAGMVLVCVPMTDFEDVIKEIHSHVRPDQVIMDICTLKEFPVKTMHKYIKTGTTLGTHPMFGPNTKSIKNQNLILTPTNLKEEAFAKKFKSWLEGRKAKVSIMSPRKHDMFMAVIFRLPRSISLVVWETNKRLPLVLTILYWVISLT